MVANSCLVPLALPAPESNLCKYPGLSRDVFLDFRVLEAMACVSFSEHKELQIPERTDRREDVSNTRNMFLSKVLCIPLHVYRPLLSLLKVQTGL